MTPINENTLDPAGQDVISAISGTGADPISDSDAGALQGIALVGASGPDGGHWQFMLTGGAWTDVGAVSDAHATLLPPDASLRYVPPANWSGSAQIAYRAWDQTSGIAGQSGVDASLNGGSTAYSAATASVSEQVIHVTAPQLIDNGADASNASAAVAITPTALQVVEPQQAPSQLTFTITTVPTHGTLTIGGQAVGPATPSRRTTSTRDESPTCPRGRRPMTPSPSS